MFYKYDKEHLIWKRDWKKMKIALSTVIVLLVISFSLGRLIRIQALDKYERELLVLSLEKEKTKFTKEKFANELKRLNVKFPHIVMAQSIIETGNFKSKVFKENNNLFGMKQANVRINTAKGTQNNHAYYDDWYQSVYDYAFYQCRYLGGIDTEEEYYLYLGQNYAEAGNYVEVVKATVQREKLKDLFWYVLGYILTPNQSMAKAKSQTIATKKEKPKVSRPGVHAKTKISKLKQSKNYKKLSVGQGKN